MNPLDEQRDSQIEETNRQTRKGKSRFRGWLTTIAGGIIGSVLTLTVVPYTPYFETYANEPGQQLTRNWLKQWVKCTTNSCHKQFINDIRYGSRCF